MPTRLETSDSSAHIDAFLAQFPLAIRKLTGEARGWFRRALPTSIERLYAGWQLIGYRVPAGTGTRYVGFIAPKSDRVVIGFEHGIYLVERFPILTGSGRQVRELVIEPGRALPAPEVVHELIVAAADLAIASRSQRLAKS